MGCSSSKNQNSAISSANLSQISPNLPPAINTNKKGNDAVGSFTPTRPDPEPETEKEKVKTQVKTHRPLSPDNEHTPTSPRDELNIQVIKACKSNDIALLKSTLLQTAQGEKASVNYKGMWNNTPLITACSYRSMECADFLLDREVSRLELSTSASDVNGEELNVIAINDKKCTALLHCCVETMNTQVLKILKIVELQSLPTSPTSKKTVNKLAKTKGRIYIPSIDQTLIISPIEACIITTNLHNLKLIVAGGDVDLNTLESVSESDAADEEEEEEEVEGIANTLESPRLPNKLPLPLLLLKHQPGTRSEIETSRLLSYLFTKGLGLSVSKNKTKNIDNGTEVLRLLSCCSFSFSSDNNSGSGSGSGSDNASIFEQIFKHFNEDVSFVTECILNTIETETTSSPSPSTPPQLWKKMSPLHLAYNNASANQSPSPSSSLSAQYIDTLKKQYNKLSLDSGKGDAIIGVNNKDFKGWTFWMYMLQNHGKTSSKPNHHHLETLIKILHDLGVDYRIKDAHGRDAFKIIERNSKIDKDEKTVCVDLIKRLSMIRVGFDDVDVEL